MEINISQISTILFITILIISKSNNIFILNTYKQDNSDDGLSSVYNSMKSLGNVINDTRHLSNKIILVAGICYLYIHLLSKENINVIYTTTEFFPVPKKWIKPLNYYYDVIIVPHEKIKEIFIRSGIKKRIYVVQQGFPKRNLVNVYKNIDQFNIGFLGVPAKRKNLNLIIKAIEYIKLKIPNIVFKVHISKNYQFINHIFTFIIKFPKNKHFNITYGYKSKTELNKWQSSLDAYIFPSSGEGWSFTPRESLSLKIPTIISDCLVHKDLEEQCNMIKLPVTTNKIINSIIEVYENIEQYKNKAKKGSIYVNKQNKNVDMLSKIKNILSNINSKKYARVRSLYKSSQLKTT